MTLMLPDAPIDRVGIRHFIRPTLEDLKQWRDNNTEI